MKKISYETANKILDLFKKPLPDKEMKKELAKLVEIVYYEGYNSSKKYGK